jgi:hypothetical protein
MILRTFVLEIIANSLVVCIAHSTNYYVKSTGSDSNNGLSFATAFKTIQTATNKVKAGDSILVYDGFYKGFDHFYKNSGSAGHEIVYYAMGNDVVINQSCGRGYDGLNIEGNDFIQVIGFKVFGISDPVGTGEDGIRAVLANHITIRNCIVDSCYRGIFTGYTDDFLAENNICKRSFGEHGIYVSNNSDRVIIRNNLCFNNKAAGIQLNPDLSSGAPGISVDVKIYNNICYNNRIGLNLQGIYYSEIYNNLIYNNGSGGGGNGMTFFWGDAATGCNDVKVYNNTVIVPATSQWAILAIDSDSLFVENNVLLSFSNKGSLDIEAGCTNYYSDYNLLNDKITLDQGSSYINFSSWQLMGHDTHSKLVKDNASVFKDLAGNDYHLSAASLAFNNGTSDVSNLVKYDLDSISRPQDGIYDIGCYEKQGISGLQNHVQDKTYRYIDLGSKFSFSKSNMDCFIEIYDLQNKMIAKGIEFDKNSFVPGIYIYQVFSARQKIWLGSGKICINY